MGLRLNASREKGIHCDGDGARRRRLTVLCFVSKGGRCSSDEAEVLGEPELDGDVLRRFPLELLVACAVVPACTSVESGVDEMSAS
jgi:hypothetical protein